MFATGLTMAGCDPCNELKYHTLEVHPSPAQVGNDVSLSSRARLDFNAGRPTFEFDFDGDGIAEDPVSGEPVSSSAGYSIYTAVAHHAYDAPATVSVSSLLRWKHGYDLKRDVLEVQPAGPAANQPPLASFTIDPNPVVPEGDYTLDATDSTDPDGQIVRYEWDLDGDGTYELDNGSNPATTQTDEGFPGAYTIGLRVTDDEGASGTTTRQQFVQDPTPRLASATRMSRRFGAGGRDFEFPPRLREIEPGQIVINGDELVVQGRVDRGRIPAGAFPAALRQGRHKIRWVSAVDATVDTATNEATGRGFALLGFPSGGRACMAFRLDVPASGKTAGSFRVRGGVGRASGLRGKGMGEGRLTADGVAVVGRLDLGFGGRESFRLGRSKCAPLLRFARDARR